MGLTVKSEENKGPSNPLWKYKETSHRSQKRLKKNEKKQQKQLEASRGHPLFGIKVGDGLEFNRFKMFRLGFILEAARSLALQFFIIFFSNLGHFHRHLAVKCKQTCPIFKSMFKIVLSGV